MILCRPLDHAIKTWVSSFEETGSVLRKKPAAVTRSVQTPETTAVRATFTWSPNRSARRHAMSCNLSRTSLRRILFKDLKLHPYKLQIVQELKPTNRLNRINFSEKMLTELKQELYEKGRALLLFLRGINKTKEFHPVANVDGTGDFDALVFKYELKEESGHALPK
jgi:hypothetical protein